MHLIYKSLNMKNDLMSVMWILEPEHGVVVLKEFGKPEDRVESALKCLPHYDPASHGNMEPASSFRYWKIRDYAHAYRSGLVTPSMVRCCYSLGVVFIFNWITKGTFQFQFIGGRVHYPSYWRVQQQETPNTIIDFLWCWGSQEAGCSLYTKVWGR